MPQGDDGRLKGFGFITFAEKESAMAAIELQGEVIDGRQIRVRASESNRQREQRQNQTRSEEY